MPSHMYFVPLYAQFGMHKSSPYIYIYLVDASDKRGQVTGRPPPIPQKLSFRPSFT